MEKFAGNRWVLISWAEEREMSNATKIKVQKLKRVSMLPPK